MTHRPGLPPLGSDLADLVDELGLDSLFPLVDQDDVEFGHPVESTALAFTSFPEPCEAVASHVYG